MLSRIIPLKVLMRDVLLLARCTSQSSIPFYSFQLRNNIFSIVLESFIYSLLSTLSSRILSPDTSCLSSLVSCLSNSCLSLGTSGSLCGSLTWVLPRSLLRLSVSLLISQALASSQRLSRIVSSVFFTPGIKLVLSYIKFISRRRTIIIIRS